MTPARRQCSCNLLRTLAGHQYPGTPACGKAYVAGRLLYFLLYLAHYLVDVRFSSVVAVCADSQIHLLLMLVAVKGSDGAKDGVFRREVNVAEGVPLRER